MDIKQYTVKVFQQQIVKHLQAIESKTDELNELRAKLEILEDKLSETLIRMLILKLDIADLEKQFDELFSE